MKSIFENVIKRGSYDLTAMLDKIDSYHIEGKITDEEREELYALARTKPEVQYNYKDEIERLWAAIKELQNKNVQNIPTEVREFIQPTGGHDAYNQGDQVLFTDGQVYMSLINNNVWSPSVYPQGWQVIE